MKVTILGKVYQLFHRARLGASGYCDSPAKPKPKILIRTGMRPKKELDTLLHEMLHACDWSKDEEWVWRAAKDMAEVLWQLGWRRTQ